MYASVYQHMLYVYIRRGFFLPRFVTFRLRKSDLKGTIHNQPRPSTISGHVTPDGACLYIIEQHVKHHVHIYKMSYRVSCSNPAAPGYYRVEAWPTGDENGTPPGRYRLARSPHRLRIRGIFSSNFAFTWSPKSMNEHGWIRMHAPIVRSLLFVCYSHFNVPPAKRQVTAAPTPYHVLPYRLFDKEL